MKILIGNKGVKPYQEDSFNKLTQSVSIHREHSYYPGILEEINQDNTLQLNIRDRFYILRNHKMDDQGVELFFKYMYTIV